MRHTDDEIERAAKRFEQLADDMDPATAEFDEVEDLRAVAAAETIRSDEARLRESVQIARAHGRSWNHIAVALGVSLKAARQRYAAPQRNFRLEIKKISKPYPHGLQAFCRYPASYAGEMVAGERAGLLGHNP